MFTLIELLKYILWGDGILNYNEHLIYMGVIQPIFSVLGRLYLHIFSQ